MIRSVTFLLVAMLPLPAAAWVQSTTSKGVGIYWPDPCLELYLNEAGYSAIEDGSEFEAIVASMETWNEVECSSVSLRYAGDTNLEITGYAKEKPSVNLILFRDSDWPYKNRPIAYTAVTYNPNTGIIIDADIELNAEDYAFTTTPELESSKIDIQNTITHELGHVIGLDHPPLPEATMFEHTGPGESFKRSLHEDDIEGLCTLYPADPEVICTEIQPQYLFYDFPDKPPGGGCHESSTSRSASPGLFLLLITGLVVLLRRRQKCSPEH